MSITGLALKATDAELLTAYAELGNVKLVGRRFGMSGGGVHSRLVKLGAAKPMNVFSEEEKDRLRSEYWIAAETGQLAALAQDMGRTKHFICRQARALSLTDQSRKKPYAAVWKYVAEPGARVMWEKFKRSSANLRQFCEKKGWDDLGFSKCMKRHFADEWEHVIEAKQSSQTLYKIGRQFEYRVRDQLQGAGYFAMRSPGSRTPIDLIAVRPGVVLFIQCKRGGTLPPGEWNALYDIAVSCGAAPILASMPGQRGAQYERLIDRKIGTSSQRQPKAPYDPFASIEAAAA